MRRQDFIDGSPVNVRFAGKDDAYPIDPKIEYGWLTSLPIAGAIFRLDDRDVRHVFSNRLFDELALGFHRESGLDMATLADRVISMADQGRDTHFECWQSADTVNRRELEISISRFGMDGEMLLLSIVDRTAEAVSRINLRREMLSDSLTGFCNRTGFEEQVESAIDVLQRSGSASGYAIILVDFEQLRMPQYDFGLRHILEGKQCGSYLVVGPQVIGIQKGQ